MEKTVKVFFIVDSRHYKHNQQQALETLLEDGTGGSKAL
jgi:hypothetical protein